MGSALPRAGPGPGRETAPAPSIHRTRHVRCHEVETGRARSGNAKVHRRQEHVIVERRPAADSLRQLVLDDLSQTFAIEDQDESGFSLERAGEVVRVCISAQEMERYLGQIEESAYDAMGLEPAWRSSVSLAAVHILAEAAMAEEGMKVVIDDDAVVGRDPPPE